MGGVGHSPPKILVGWATMHLAPARPIGQLIFRKVCKIGSRRCQILRLKRTKFARLRPRRGAYSAPPCPYLYLRSLLLRGGRERGREGKVNEREGIEEVEEGISPTRKFWRGAPMA